MRLHKWLDNVEVFLRFLTEEMNKSLPQNFQTGSAFHPASYSLRIRGCFHICIFQFSVVQYVCVRVCTCVCVCVRVCMCVYVCVPSPQLLYWMVFYLLFATCFGSYHAIIRLFWRYVIFSTLILCKYIIIIIIIIIIFINCNWVVTRWQWLFNTNTFPNVDIHFLTLIYIS
jgi:hypothetical protein